MKKKQLIIIAVAALLLIGLIAVFLAARGSEAAAENASLLPFTENVVMYYEIELGGRDEEMSYKSFNAYVRNNHLQRLIMLDDGSFIVEVLRFSDEGRLASINTFSDTSQWVSPFTDVIDMSPQMYVAILPANIALGERWVADPLNSNSASQTVREITGIDVSVTTPAGTFNTIEVTTTSPADESFRIPPTVRTYFAPGIGVVMDITFGGISTNMANWEERLANREETINTKRLVDIKYEGLTLDVPVFYLDETDSFGGGADGSIFPTVQVNFTTNNDLNKVYGEAMSRVAQTLFGRELGADVLQGAFINPNSQNLILDFSSALLNLMQNVASHEAEERIINAIVDTFGAIYNAQGVTITIDDVPYKGPFVAFRSMEFRPVTHHNLYAHE